MNSPRMQSTGSLLARARRGFTLIELLTVIAIIGILAAIIIPTVGKVRESARAAQCASNVRQIAMAIVSYSNDNRGFAPMGQSGPAATPVGVSQSNTWQIEIMPYLGQTPSTVGTTAIQQRKAQEVLKCPTFISQKNPTDAQLDNGYFGIGLNLALGVPETPPGPGRNARDNRIRITKFSSPSRIVLIGDSDETTDSSRRFQMLFSNLGDPNTVRDNGGLRHGSRANYGFADGHVKGLTPEEATAVLRPNP